MATCERDIASNKEHNMQKGAIKNTTFIATSSSEMKGVNILKSLFDLGDAVGFNSQFFYSE